MPLIDHSKRRPKEPSSRDPWQEEARIRSRQSSAAWLEWTALQSDREWRRQLEANPEQPNGLRWLG